MKAERHISGIHHITAIASVAAVNLQFYESVLGLRLVKKTVNFDDPYTYHLYYGDDQGSPGTVITFFPWENLPPGRPGAGMVTAINFAVPRNAIDFWTRRLQAHDIQFNSVERFGEPVIKLSDPHGLPIELTGSDKLPSTVFWKDSPIAESNAIAGFHSATATLKSASETKALLVDQMGMSLADQAHNRYRFKMGDPASPGNCYDVVVDPKAPPGKPGAGTVHHIAFRTTDDATQAGWQSVLRQSGVPVTNVRDRKYFRSIYFNAPEGVLFEIATDPPGFGVDEPEDQLGASLKLPDQYESMRVDIEKRLPPLHPMTYRHTFKSPCGQTDDGQTLVALHGTGGNEHDLIDFAAHVSPRSAILSPRGNVVENGLSRFFNRLAPNRFDEADVVRRAHELADFIVSAAAIYDREPARMTAIGYSNGANIAAAVVLLRPDVFFRAVLLRPMVPLQELTLPDLSAKKILILKGEHDAVIPTDSTDRLADLFISAGADVTLRRIDAGHEITQKDAQIISRWLERQRGAERQADKAHVTEVTAR